MIIINEDFYELNGDFNYHYFGENIYVSTPQTIFNLNSLYSSVLSLINENISIESIYKYICNDYKLDEKDNEVIQAFNNIITELNTKNIIKIKNNNKYFNNILFTGKKHKYYPKLILIELTNQCNFTCPHCYKEANNKKNIFIDENRLYQFFSKLDNKVEHIELSGGEATLHPNINNIIRHLKKYTKHISLLTNGSNISKLDDDVLKILSDIQITLYGYNSNSYYNFTNNKTSYDDVIKGLDIIEKKHVPIIVAIMLNKQNFSFIDKYIDIIKNYTLKDLRFGMAMPFGRALSEDFKGKYNLSKEDINYVNNELEKYINNSYNKIETHHIRYSTLLRTENEYSLKCGAGKNIIIIGQDCMIRPCNMLPEDLFKVCSIEEYFDIINKGFIYDFSQNIYDFEKKLITLNLTLEDIKCTGFCDIEV